MTIKASHALAFAKVAAPVFVLTALAAASGKGHLAPHRLLQLAALPAVLVGLAIPVLFTPRRISWDEKGISITTVLFGTRQFPWPELVAYSGIVRGVLLLKFRDKPTCHITPLGFSGPDWDSFTWFLQSHFPEKKATRWIGPDPRL